MPDIHKRKANFLTENDPIQALWDQRGEEGTEDLPDQVQKKLELDTLLSFIQPEHCVIDLGCGNGNATHAIAQVGKEVLGVEYSTKILKKALNNEENNLSFIQGDVRKLEGIASEYYDIAISERSLINLNNQTEQGIAIDQIHRVLKHGGKYLMLETSQQGVESLSYYRQQFGLTPIDPPWHNLPIDDDWLFGHIEEKYKHVDTIYFGLYFLITRIVHPLFVAPDKPSYMSKLNAIASQISRLIPNRNGEMSQIKLHILQKK